MIRNVKMEIVFSPNQRKILMKIYEIQKVTLSRGIKSYHQQVSNEEAEAINAKFLVFLDQPLRTRLVRGNRCKFCINLIYLLHTTYVDKWPKCSDAHRPSWGLLTSTNLAVIQNIGLQGRQRTVNNQFKALTCKSKDHSTL